VTRFAQQGQYTVGDTFTVVHRIAVPAGSVVQPRAPVDTNLVTLLGTPTVAREGDSVRIAYSVAVWAPGRNELVIPGAVIVSGTGRIDTLPDARLPLDVATVLPRDQAAASIVPRAARPWVERGEVTWLPFVVLIPLTLLIIAAVWWWRRRRGPLPAAHPPRSAATADPARLQGWLEAGEVRLVLDHLEHALAGRASAASWHADVARVRFAPARGEELIELCRAGLALLASPSP
jgi:hypothetical protein